MLGDEIVTKIIRPTADNFNQKREIVLNKSALLCELDIVAIGFCHRASFSHRLQVSQPVLAQRTRGLNC